MTDADAHADEVAADMRGRGAETVMPGQAAPDLHSDLARGEVELVVKDHDVTGLELVKAHGFAHGTARRIHEGLRLQQQHLLLPELAFGNVPLEALAPIGEAVRCRDGIDRHEADIVTVEGVFLFRIAEADKELHRSHPIQRAKARESPAILRVENK